jgi:radical SAM protein with 4Fe4S-binding SPASM domain
MTKPYTRIQTDSGQDFFYNNRSNILSDSSGVSVSLRSADDLEYVDLAKATYNKKTKSSSPVAFRILMGHACNYSCSYCMQMDIGNPDELPKRKNLDKFFEDVSSNFDLSNLERIELWGGEPFLYWNDMVPLMNFFDADGRTFAISTNGSCLSPKHAEFFATLKSHVIISISHDGPMQEQLRGEEILGRPRVINTLRMFDELENVGYGFQCSVTNTNFDLFAINDFFRGHIIANGLQTNSLSFSLGRTYQEGGNGFDYLACSIIDGQDKKTSDSQLHVIHGENLKKFRVILREYLEAHHQQMVKNGFDGDEPAIYGMSVKDLPLLLCDIYESDIAYSVIGYSRKLLNNEPILETTNCGADMSDIISLDLDGSVRTCPHAGEKYVHGHINNIKGVRILTLNLTKKDTHCADCSNIKLCRSSCPLDLPEQTFLTNCAVEKVWYGELQRAAFRFVLNEQISSMEYGLEEIEQKEFA